jgi:hypothetical protein
MSLFLYTNGRNQTISILELYRDPELCYKLNAKLFTQLKKDMKENFHVVCKPGRYGKAEFWISIFQRIKQNVDEETFLTKGYPFNFESNMNRYGYSVIIN